MALYKSGIVTRGGRFGQIEYMNLRPQSFQSARNRDYIAAIYAPGLLLFIKSGYP